MLFSYILCASFLKVAIKSIRKEKIKDEQDLVHIRREIEIMSSLCHPHIITIYEGMCTVRVYLLLFFCVEHSAFVRPHT